MKHLKNFTDIVNLKELKSNMTYKDLKIECVIRGMEFDKITASDFPNLAHWLVKNVTKKTDLSLLEKYDDYVDDLLRKAGKDEFIHPSLRLGYISDSTDERETNIKKDNKEKVEKTEKKKSRKKDKNGIIKSTKKSLTYKLQRKGYNIEKVIKRVLRRFPDANEKSIKIWFKKSLRERKDSKDSKA